MDPVQLRKLEVASFLPLHGPSCSITSALYMPLMVSAAIMAVADAADRAPDLRLFTALGILDLKVPDPEDVKQICNDALKTHVLEFRAKYTLGTIPEKMKLTMCHEPQARAAFAVIYHSRDKIRCASRFCMEKNRLTSSAIWP